MGGGGVGGVAPAHRMPGEDEAVPAQAVGHRQHVGGEILHLVGLARAPAGAAEAAHVHGDDLAAAVGVAGQFVGDADPVVGKVGLAVQNDHRRAGPGVGRGRAEMPVEDRDVAGLDGAGPVVRQGDGCVHGLVS